MKRFLGIAVLGLIALSSTAQAQVQMYKYSRVVFPSGSTSVADISNSGTMIGSNGSFGPWIQERGGEPVLFSLAGATGVSLSGINASETIVGSCSVGGVFSPFISDKSGANWRTLPRVDNVTTLVNAISNNGLVFGNRLGTGFPQRGVIIDTKKDDAVTYVNYPGATATNLIAGNDNGLLFGQAIVNNTIILWTAKHGKFEPYTLPDGTPSPASIAADTNNRGDLLLVWTTSPDGVGHTGILRANGNFEELDYPGLGDELAATEPPTTSLGIWVFTRVDGKFRLTGAGLNDRGDVVGSVSQAYTGFLGTIPFPLTLYRTSAGGFLAEKGAGEL